MESVRRGHGTYEITASTYYAASGQQIRPPWRLFDHQSTDGSYWQQTYGIDGYSNCITPSPYEYTGSTRDPITTTTDVGGTRYLGHWVQIKVPNSVTLAHADVYRTPEYNLAVHRIGHPGPECFLVQTTAWRGTNSRNSVVHHVFIDDKERIAVNATTPYQYYRFVITNIVGGQQQLSISTEWRLFAEKPVTKLDNVHISGDLSSQTLQTGYIKWPRPLLADSYKGYELSSSTNHNVGLHNEFSHGMRSMSCRTTRITGLHRGRHSHLRSLQVLIIIRVERRAKTRSITSGYRLNFHRRSASRISE